MEFKIEITEGEFSKLLGYDITRIQKSEEEVIQIIGAKFNVNPEDFYVNIMYGIRDEVSLKLSRNRYEINFTHNID